MICLFFAMAFFDDSLWCFVPRYNNDQQRHNDVGVEERVLKDARQILLCPASIWSIFGHFWSLFLTLTDLKNQSNRMAATIFAISIKFQNLDPRMSVARSKDSTQTTLNGTDNMKLHSFPMIVMRKPFPAKKPNVKHSILVVLLNKNKSLDHKNNSSCLWPAIFGGARHKS